MKVIDVLSRVFPNANVVIKHMVGIGDSQHYIYKGNVADIRFEKDCPYHDKEVLKIYVNCSVLIIVIE